MRNLEEVAQTYARLSPGMREANREEREADGEASWEVARAERDTCLRVAFAANEIVKARLEDADGNVVADENVREGVLGARGPVCVRAGGRVTARFTGEGKIRVRVVVWRSP